VGIIIAAVCISLFFYFVVFFYLSVEWLINKIYLKAVKNVENRLERGDLALPVKTEV
jgi:uncharacterized membrane protein